MNSDNETVVRLVEELYLPEKEERARAASALAELGSEAVYPLIDLLEDESWVVRYRAAEALGMIGDERAVPALKARLGDEKDHVRYMAAKGLGNFGKEGAPGALLPMLTDENEYVRRITAISIGRIGSFPGAAEALAEAMEKETDQRALEAMKDALSRV